MWENVDMKIRLATANDIDTLIKVRFDYFLTENWELTPEKKTLIYSQLKQYFTSHLNLDFFAAFAEDASGEIASAAFLAISEKPANLSFPTGKTGTILNVLTYPQYRRMGFATKVLVLLIKKAKSQNLSFIELSATDQGKPLYEKIGFQQSTASHYTEMKLKLL